MFVRTFMSAFNYCSIGRRYRATRLRITILHCYILLPPETVHAQGPRPNLHEFPFFHFKLLAEVPDKVGPSENAPFYYVSLLYRFTGHFCPKNLNPVFTNMRHTHAPGSVLINANPQLVLAISAPQMRACCFGRIAATFDHGSFEVK